MTKVEKSSEFDQFRAKVLENELIARFNKSEYDKMYYYLEAKKISVEFLKEAKEDEQEREDLQSSVEKQIKAQVETQNAE